MSVTQNLSVTEVVGSVNNVANTSKVRILWQSTQSGDSWNGYTRTAKYYVSINGGAETAYSVTYTLPKNSTKTIVDTTLTINHKGDGTGSVKVRTWMDTSISAGVVEKTQTITLTTIPKASTLDSLTCATQYFNGALTYKYTPKSSSYYNRCVIELNLNGTYTQVKSISLGKQSASQQTATVTLSESELSTIYNKIPNDNKGKLQFTFRTYSDSGYSTQVGEAGTKDITLYIPDDTSTQPTVSMSLTPSSTLKSPYNSLYIQGHSRVKATLGVTTKYGAKEDASNITVNGNAYASPYESGILSQAGKVSVKATVKDSRGYYGTNYKEIEVIPYSKPYVQAKSNESSIIAARCDSSANFTDSGTYLKIKAKVVYSKVISDGVQKNYGNIKYRYRKEGGTFSAWQTILDGEADNSDEVITPPLLNGALDVKSNYQVQIIASDDLYDSEPITISVPSDDVYMDRPPGGKSMGLGGYSSGDGNLDVYWKTKARGGISLFDSKGNEIPLGSALPLPRDQIKGDWNPNNLECGTYIVTDSSPLKSGETVIMYNGVLIQMIGNVGGNVKVQLSLPVDGNRSPMYRLCWYSNWSDWKSMKL